MNADMHAFANDGQTVDLRARVNGKISAQQAHQVAMIAAHEAARGLADVTPFNEIGSAIAKAYLQAYEAVEGWTKPVPEVDIYRELSVPCVSLEAGRSVDIFNRVAARYMRITVNDDGSYSWDDSYVGGKKDA